MSFDINRLLQPASLELYDELKKNALVGQKKTSAHKALVYLPPSDRSHVYKGSYAWPQKKPMLTQMLFRSELFSSVWREAVVLTRFELLTFPNGDVFVRMPHVQQLVEPRASVRPFEGVPQPILGEEKPRLVASKQSQGLMEFSTYLDQPQSYRNALTIVRAVLHFIDRAICNPTVGDAALRNVLVCIDRVPHVAVGIDFEENRALSDEKQREAYENGLFGMICGGKLWSKTHLETIRDALLAHKSTVLEHLTRVAASHDEIAALATRYGLQTSVDVERMMTNCRHVTEMVASDNFGGVPRAKRTASGGYGAEVATVADTKKQRTLTADEEEAERLFEHFDIDRFLTDGAAGRVSGTYFKQANK